ncbi:PQQ-binding-like beta-propeller repeat protein [Yinghuangia aomiensis]
MPSAPLDPLVVHRVLGSRPYAEIGRPFLAARDDRSGVLAAAGYLGGMQWPGRDASEGRAAHRVGIYTRDGLRHLLRTRHQVQALAFHPELPLLAIGTGGWYYEGELLLVDLGSGRVVSVFDGERDVSGLRWLDARTLDVRMATSDDEDLTEEGPSEVRELLVREDWTQVAGRSVAVDGLPYAPPQFMPLAPPVESAGEVARLHAEIEGAGDPRGPVWAVEPLPDGGLLATHHGAQVERWDPDGTLRWAVAKAEGGRELLCTPDGSAVWVNGTTRTTWGFSGWEPQPYPVDLIAVRDGAVLGTVDPGFAVAAAMRTDGWLALRDCRVHVEKPLTVLVGPDGAEAARVEVGEYSLFAHHFPVRRSPELLFLQGEGVQGTVDRWVVAVDPPTSGGAATLRRLFPLDWDPGPGGQVAGGPAVFHTDDAGGPALIHGGRVRRDRKTRLGSGYVVRRAYPSGEPVWVFTADAAPAAVEADGDTVYVALTSGEVVALDASDGTVRSRGLLRLDGRITDPLSLAVAAPGRVVVGMVDGRIAECGFAGPPGGDTGR